MTFTVLAAFPERNLLAAATASRSLAVGNAVLSLEPQRGAVASQAYTNRSLRRLMLEAMGRGEGPSAAVNAMAALDPGIENRQLVALGPDGIGAAFTGSACSGWAGHVVGTNYVVAGNLLVGPQVLDAMIAVLEVGIGRASTPEALSLLICAALAAGDAAGGDARGRQSAALVVSSERSTVGDLDIDLRVDDAAEPVAELSRLLSLAHG